MANNVRILIVEDEALLAMHMEMELKKAGYEVCERTATGEAAVNMVKEKGPTVVLMDIRLAGEIDGIQAARRIRIFCDVPIIFMTGYPDKDIQSQIDDLGPFIFCAKPVRVQQLKSIIESIRN